MHAECIIFGLFAGGLSWKLYQPPLPDLHSMGRFAIVDDDAIRRGECTDIYCVRTEEILRRSGKNPRVAVIFSSPQDSPGRGRESLTSLLT